MTFRPSPSRVIGWMCFAIGMAGAVPVQAADPDAALPASLRDVLKDARLVISPESLGEKPFSFVVEYHKNVEGRLERSFDILVCRDADRVAALVRYADRLPYCLFARGFAAVVVDDPNAQVRVLTKGNPHFAMRVLPDGRFSLLLSQREGEAEPPFVLDVLSMLNSNVAASSSFDASTLTASVQWKQSSCEIEFCRPAAAGEPLTLSRVTVTDPRGNRIVARDFRVGPTARVSPARVTLDAIRRAGIPIQELDDADGKRIEPFPSASAIKNERMRGLATKLAELQADTK